jgi:hypothetical protein
VKLVGRIGYTKISIEDAWVRIRERFASTGSTTEFVFGTQNAHLEGAGNRVVFEQTDSDIKFESQYGGAGQIGTLYDSCVARCWGVDPSVDYSIDQGLAAKALAVDVAAAFYLSFSGYAKGLQIEVANETPVLKYGEQYAVFLTLPCPIYVVDNSVKLPIAGANVSIGKR